MAQRSREIGVRLALGASPARMVRLVVSRTALWLAAGVVLGLEGAGLGARHVHPLLFETSAFDPVVYGLAAAVVALVALAASAVPARRAARVDPNVARRAE